MLRQVQKNQVLEILLDAGLDPSQFSWQERAYTTGLFSGEPADLLVHNESQNYLFEFTLRPGHRHYSRMRPGSQAIEETAFPESWQNQLTHVRQWASDLRDELDAPDHWSSIPTWNSLAQLPPTFDENSPFTSEELDAINRRLDAVVERINDFADSHQEMAHQLVEHLREQAPKHGRRDWFLLALGSFVSLGVAATYDPSRTKELIDLLVQGTQALGGG